MRHFDDIPQASRPAAQGSAMGGAVCLVEARPAPVTKQSANQQYVLRVTEEGKRLLQSAAFNETPLLVASIVGPARSGKSTLLNCILKRLGCPLPDGAGFVVGHTTDKTTEGIWLWPMPITIQNRQHQLVSVQGHFKQRMVKTHVQPSPVLLLLKITTACIIHAVYR